jgi:hypothetical protein
MTISCMRIAYWIPKDANTHSEYVIRIVFHYNNDGTIKPQCYVICRSPVLLKTVVTNLQRTIQNAVQI